MNYKMSIFDSKNSTPCKLIIDGYKQKKNESPILYILKKWLKKIADRLEKYDYDSNNQ